MRKISLRFVAKTGGNKVEDLVQQINLNNSRESKVADFILKKRNETQQRDFEGEKKVFCATGKYCYIHIVFVTRGFEVVLSA